MLLREREAAGVEPISKDFVDPVKVILLALLRKGALKKGALRKVPRVSTIGDRYSGVGLIFRKG